MTQAPTPSSTAKASAPANNRAGDGGDDFTFRAPRWADLKACPVCSRNPDDLFPGRCDFCGDEAVVFSETMQ